MKIIAIVFNIILLGFVISLFIEEDFPSVDDDMFLFAIFMVLTPLINLFVLFFKGGIEKTWLGLYFKRKALEEQKKIDQMKS